MKNRSDSTLRFTYFYYDPFLFYSGVHTLDGKVIVPDYLEQQEELLDTMLAVNNSRYFRERFQAGDEEAIFEYAMGSRVCIESPWVVDQIEAWRIKDTPETRRKLKRFFRCYMGEGRGKASWDDLKRLIKKDQRIFLEILKLKRKSPHSPLRGNRHERGIFELVREKMEGLGVYVTRDTVELVYNRYVEVARKFTGGSATISPKLGIGRRATSKKREDRHGRFKDPLEFIKYFMSTSLDEILSRSADNALYPLGLDFRCSRCQKRVVRKCERISMD